MQRSKVGFTNLNEMAEGKQPKVDTARIRYISRDFGVFSSDEVQQFAKNPNNVTALANVIDQKDQQEKRVEKAKTTGGLPF